MVRHLLLITCLALGSVPSAAIAGPTVAELQKERVALAAKSYASAAGGFKAGRTTAEIVCQWSVRWLDSELDAPKPKQPQVFADHAARMVLLEADAKQAASAGTLPSSEVDTVRYFRVEADLWVARGAKK